MDLNKLAIQYGIVSKFVYSLFQGMFVNYMVYHKIQTL